MKSTRNSAIGRAGATALVALMFVVVVWGCLHGRSVHREAAFYSWLESTGTRTHFTVVELGEARSDGGALQAWVKNPGGIGCAADQLSLDLSKTRERITRVSQQVDAVVSCQPGSPLENPPDGVASSALNHNFAADYLRQLAIPVLLIILDLAALFALRRTRGPSGRAVSAAPEEAGSTRSRV